MKELRILRILKKLRILLEITIENTTIPRSKNIENYDIVIFSRWNAVVNMVEFRNVTYDYGFQTPLRDANSYVINRDGMGGMYIYDGLYLYPSGMPDGYYCEIISGRLENGQCTGMTVSISNGLSTIASGNPESKGVLAYHINAKL